MPSYDASWSEIQAGFDKAYQSVLKRMKEEGTAPEDVLLSETLGMKATLGNYIEFRNKALAELLKILSGFSDSLTEKSQADNWKNKVSKMGQDAFKMISDLDDNDNPSELNTFFLQTATRAGWFFNQIASMQFGAIQGFLCESAKTFREEKKKLLGKWSTTERSAKDLNQKGERAGKEMLEVFNKALTEVGKENRRAAELLKTALLAYKKWGDLKTGGEPGIPDLFEEIVNRLEISVDKAEDVADLYRNAYKNKATTLVLYCNNRESVEEFLNKTNLELAMKRTKEVQDKAKSLAGDSKLTSGQQKDLAAFVAEANKAIKGPVENLEKGFNDFIYEFKGIFVGPIGNNVLDQLLQGKFWEQTEYGMKRLNFESELKKYYKEAGDRMWNIPLDGLDDDLKKAFKDAFKKELREYDDVLERAIRTYTRVAKEFFYDRPVSKLKDMLSRSKGWDG